MTPIEEREKKFEETVFYKFVQGFLGSEKLDESYKKSFEGRYVSIDKSKVLTAYNFFDYDYKKGCEYTIATTTNKIKKVEKEYIEKGFINKEECIYTSSCAVERFKECSNDVYKIKTIDCNDLSIRICINGNDTWTPLVFVTGIYKSEEEYLQLLKESEEAVEEEVSEIVNDKAENPINFNDMLSKRLKDIFYQEMEKRWQNQ